MTTENCRRDLTAICEAADSGNLLHEVRDGSFEPLAEKDLSHRPDWPTPDSLIGWHAVPDQQAWSTKVGTFAQLQAAGF
ncbi:hypothetical protein [Streptomyces sp. NBC_00154]|uniref:hypothetical protein n=1 Tax=Streptomyces sp. NBC_00154 TaxID=2975670 RepID=UPI00225A905A|nr:hypothetical protein [Streptomyces sp. NBC_00154]MCX5309796.1 hypothetical protein [Streptomyces sp. NBC_00154]